MRNLGSHRRGRGVTRWIGRVLLHLAWVSSALLASAAAEADAPAAPAVEVGYDNGFYLQRNGGAQKLKIYGYMQALWTGDFDEAGMETNEFRVRRGRLLVAGTVVRDLTFKVQLDFVSSKPLQDCYMNYQPWEAFGLRAGQFKTPLGRQFLVSASKKQFVDDNLATAAFKLDRDIGLMVHGAVEGGLFGYQVGVFNGAGKNALQDNLDLLYVARLEVAPFGPVPYAESDVAGTASPLLSLAVATGYNTVDVQPDPEGAAVTTSRYTVGGEVALFWRGLYAAAEVFWRLDDPASGENLAGLGGSLQAGYMVIPKHLELGARGAVVRGDMAVTGDDHWEAGPVINGFFLGHHLKLQLDYAALLDEDPLGPDDLAHRVRLQLQAAF